MKPLLVIVSTTRYAVDRFMLSALDELQSSYDIISINGESSADFILSSNKKISSINIPLRRKINIFWDFVSLIKLIWILIDLRPALVQTLTPKAGLIGIIGAWLAFVPRRVHYFTGQVWATHSGLKRILFKLIDRMIVMASTATLADSKSQLKFLIQNNVVNSDECSVLGMGSLGGVDINKFKSNKDFYLEKRMEMRLPSNAFIILYMARLTIDKGALGLVRTFKKYRDLGGNGILLCVGPDEENLLEQMNAELGYVSKFVNFIGYTDSPEYYFKISDVFFMPSLREGFGVYIY